MPISDIIRRTKPMRLREPRLDSNNYDPRTALNTNPENGKRERQASGAPGHSQVRDESPYLNRPSEEFFTNLIEYPDESLRGPNHSLASSPIDAGSPESFIGIALGNPEVDPQNIKKSEARQGYISNGASSLNSSATLHSGLAADDYVAGTATSEQGRWASFTGRFDIKNAAMIPPSSYPGGQTSPASPRPHHSKLQEAPVSDCQHSLPGPFHQCRHRQDSAPYPRAMKQMPRIGLSKKPSLIKRKLSWRRNPSRKSHAQVEPNRGSEYCHSRPFSPLAPHIEQPEKTKNTMKQSDSHLNRAEVSLLHVEIPHIEMERYSVMFSNLLQAAEQPSLLNRRQGPLARIKLATKTRTQLLQSSTLLPPAIPTTAPPTPSALLPTPSSPARPAGRVVTNTGFEEGSLPRLRGPSDQPIRTKVGHSDLAGPPDLLVMVHHSHDTSKDERLPTKHFSRLHLSNILGSPSATQTSTPSSSNSSPIVLPRRSSSLPISQPPIQTNTPQISAPEEALPTAIPASASASASTSIPTEISIARQISISRRQRHMVVPHYPKTN